MIDGIYQSDTCYNLKDLTVEDLISLRLNWTIDGDRGIIKLT